MATSNASNRLSVPCVGESHGYARHFVNNFCEEVHPKVGKPEAVIETVLPPGALSLAFKDGRPYRARMCVTAQTRGYAPDHCDNPKPVGNEIATNSSSWSDAGWEACHLLGKWTGAPRIITVLNNHLSISSLSKDNYDAGLPSLYKNANLFVGTKWLNRSHGIRSVAAKDAAGGMAYVEQKVKKGLDNASFTSVQLVVTPLYRNDDDCIPSSIVMDVLTEGSAADAIDAEFEITDLTTEGGAEYVMSTRSREKFRTANEKSLACERSFKSVGLDESQQYDWFHRNAYLYAYPSLQSDSRSADERIPENPRLWLDGGPLSETPPKVLITDNIDPIPPYTFLATWSDDD